MKQLSISYLVLSLIASGLLMWAINDHPYSYYIILRWVVFGVAIFGVYQSIIWKKYIFTWALGITAFIFNPILSFHFSRETWAPIDIISAIIFIVSIFFIGKRRKLTAN
jgi:hypothetical protein